VKVALITPTVVGDDAVEKPVGVGNADVAVCFAEIGPGKEAK
jgi:hypothetical protein